MVDFENIGFEVPDLGVKWHNLAVRKSYILYFTFVYLKVP